MKKFLLVDGHNLLFQMFYGMPARIYGKNDKPVHAIIGFVGALLKVINVINPSKILVIFDGEITNFRNYELPDYKGNRQDFTDVEETDNPFAQLDGIKKALDFINIAHYEVIDNYEADDIMASYAKQSQNTDTYILSNDSDFMQLINSHVKLYIYRGKKSIIFDEQKVLEKYGVTSQFFADYKCFIGDKSDNIKGIPKVGVKTAAKLVNKYGTIENVIADLEEITPWAIKKSISENSEQLIQNKKLILLKGDTPIPYSMSEVSFQRKHDLKTYDILKSIGIM